MPAITTLRSSIAAALADNTKYSVFAFPPATPIANSVIVTPADPYIVPSNKDYMDTETFAKAMFQYSAHLSSLTATLVLDAVLTKSQISEMMDTIKEMESMGKDVASE